MNEDYLKIVETLPKEVYSTKELSLEDKLILERLVSLCRKERYCWISNRKLAEMYGIKIDSVTTHIRRLRQYGIIECKYIKDSNKKS